MNKFDVAYFIKKFEATTNQGWAMGKFQIKVEEFSEKGNRYYTKFCALGHCGAYFAANDTEESRALDELIGESPLRYGEDIFHINDGKEGWDTAGDTPRERILHVLYHIREAEG